MSNTQDAHQMDEMPYPGEEPRRRPEYVRILLFLAVNLGVSAVFTLLQMGVTQGMYRSGVVSGDLLTAVSLVATYVPPVIATLLNRRITFRSCAFGWLAAGGMLLLKAAWQVGYGLLINRMMPEFDVSVYSDISSMSNLAWLVVTYLLQRFFFFRRTLDTL